MALNNLNWSLEYYESHTVECNEILNSLSDYDRIPLIDSASIQTFADGMLVRYQGMIQDMLNPEYYSQQFKVVNKENNETYVRLGKFRDVASCKANEELKLIESDFVPNERLVFFCVPIPGLNDWVQDLIKPKKLSKSNEDHSLSLKRQSSDENDDVEMKTDTSPLTTSKKRNKSTEGRNEATSQYSIYDNKEYFPFSNQNGVPCIVKVYEEEQRSSFVLNDTVEVIGFLSLNLALEANWEDADVEDKAHYPPPSLVPRLHALIMRKLHHCNPLLKQIIPYADIDHFIESARSDLHLILTQLLFDDTFAADYMLCNLISRIHIRNESNTIGKFSLNLFNIGLENFAASFYDILKMIVTNSHYVALSTNLLNNSSFVPRKDYESNRLHSGMLQLCDDVHLVLDETKMNEGQLNNTGYSNFNALQKLFKDQEIEYDFGFYAIKYNTDIPLLVLSEGKSMFEADIRMKVLPNSCNEIRLKESLEAVKLYLNTEVLNKIRIYITSVKLRDFELSEEMMRKIKGDYVSLRQQDRKFSSSDLHILLVLTRLLALSRGRTVSKPQDWAQALEMEAERKSRLL